VSFSAANGDTERVLWCRLPSSFPARLFVLHALLFAPQCCATPNVRNLYRVAKPEPRLVFPDRTMSSQRPHLMSDATSRRAPPRMSDSHALSRPVGSLYLDDIRLVVRYPASVVPSRAGRSRSMCLLLVCTSSPRSVAQSPRPH
jgi:hypothetical protein